MTTDFRTEDEQRAWLEALVVGDRVTHSSADAAGIAGTVTATDDPEHQMGDIRVQWDAPLPWLKGNFDADHGWHSPGFLRPAPDEAPLPPYEKARLQLLAARALLEAPERWSAGMIARDADDRCTEPDSWAACSWCAVGALLRVTGQRRGAGFEESATFQCFREVVRDELVDRALHHLLVPATSGSVSAMVSDWNDHADTTHGQIIAAFDGAVAVAETHRDFAAAT